MDTELVGDKIETAIALLQDAVRHLETGDGSEVRQALDLAGRTVASALRSARV
jgi:hypothetical protein